LELDHVLIAVDDLDAAAEQLEAHHGLASVAGGRHPGWGTANRIVPLGETYLELVAIVDDAEAARSAFGSWVASSGTGPFGWAVRTDDLDAVAARLGLTVSGGSRLTPDGQLLRWRAAVDERPAAGLPFFLRWADDSLFPGRTAVTHPAGEVALQRLELLGDAGRIARWLGPHDLPIVVREGAPAVERVVLSGGIVVTGARTA
jgi:Glyoxalase-like domain